MLSALIVDDDRATVDAILNKIDWESLNVTRLRAAYSVEQARRALAERDFDLVISDIEMPGETGLDLLSWYRAAGKTGQFLLLTCHESFHYASEALRYQAADYLLKPFDAQTMELALRRSVAGLMERRSLEEHERWVNENRRQLHLSFWESVFRGRYERRQTPPDLKPCDLVVCRVTNREADLSRYGLKLFHYALENIHSELLCGTPENCSVVTLDYKSYTVVCAVSEHRSPEELERRCRRLKAEFSRVMQSELTCCICGQVELEQMFERCYTVTDRMARDVAKYGTVFWERELRPETEGEQKPLDLERLRTLLENGKKREFLEYLKSCLEEARAEGRLTEKLLFALQQGVLQTAYVELSRNGLTASRVELDDTLRELREKSTQSSLDLLRWAAGVLNAVLELRQRREEESSLPRRVDAWLEAHYREDIGREQVAEALHLSPGYLGKLYKKETGQTVGDRLAEIRVEHAREELALRRCRITDVALNVGFENTAYFSTVFKKYTGMTPHEYRKSLFGDTEQED